MIQKLEESKEQFSQKVLDLQNAVINQLLALDQDAVLTQDQWVRQDFLGAPGGGGKTCVLAGKVIENAGVNTSLIYGAVNPQFGQKLWGKSSTLWATGLSLIIHPRSPRIPTVHANFRMIHSGEKVWFGGGADLTPYYPHLEDFKFFHQTWQQACAPYGDFYQKAKDECDRYFVNHHREGEMRGIGGIFFDHYQTGNLTHDLHMVEDLADHFIPSYFPLAVRRIGESWTEEDEDFQQHRRGRYVEFNLLHDRGTQFGLESRGRVDSILVSLPARCKFTYCYAPPPQGPHEKMMDYYRPHQWV